MILQRLTFMLQETHKCIQIDAFHVFKVSIHLTVINFCGETTLANSVVFACSYSWRIRTSLQISSTFCVPTKTNFCDFLMASTLTKVVYSNVTFQHIVIVLGLSMELLCRGWDVWGRQSSGGERDHGTRGGDASGLLWWIVQTHCRLTSTICSRVCLNWYYYHN